MNAFADIETTHADFQEWAVEGRNELMAKLQAQGRVVAPVGEPSWEGVTNPVTHKVWWEGPQEVAKPTSFIYHWGMPEGQLRTTTRYRRVRIPGESEFFTSDLHLDVVSKESKRWVIRASGKLEDHHSEMAAGIAAFPRGTDQALVDQVASLLWKIAQASLSDDPAERIALLAIGTRCLSCRRTLRDEISKIIGFGPTCAQEIGIPHTLEFARQVEARRAAP